MQYLRIPFRRAMMLCGYKNPEYLAHWGYAHYGIDISTIQGGAGTDPTVYASGEGVVVAAGWDSKLGGAVCVKYNETFNRASGESVTVIARYMHLAKVLVQEGDMVSLDTPLAVEGKEGTGDYHLHLEFDTDIQYPRWTPQVSRGLSFWVHGVDSTLNPSDLLYTDKEHQLVEPTYNPDWLNSGDFAIPPAPPNEQTAGKAITLEKLVSQLRSDGISSISL